MSYSLNSSRTYITADLEEKKVRVWYRRSRLEKILLVCTLLLILLSIGLLVGLILAAIKDKEERAGNDDSSPPSVIQCETPACLIAAASIQDALDPSVDPCADFYQYACGGWMRKNVIPPDRSRWGQFDRTRVSLVETVRVLLDSNDDNQDNSIVVNKTKALYKGCMNLNSRDNASYSDLLTILRDIQWPWLNSSWTESDYEWETAYAYLSRRFGFSFILSNYVAQDALNTTIYSIYIDAPSFGVGWSQLVNPNTTYNSKILEAYVAFIESSVNLLTDGEPALSASLAQEIEDLLEFEKRLANITLEARRDRFDLYGNKSTIRQFMDNEEYGGIDLLRIETIVFNDGLASEGLVRNITEDEGLIIYDREYFQQIQNILSSTDKRTIANYLGWRTVRSLGTYTTRAFRALEFEYNKVVSGVEEPRALWEDCVDAVNARLPFAVGAIYVNNSFSDDAKQDLERMIDELDKAFRQLLDSNDWMNESTKQMAAEKLDNMLRAIAYPDFIKNETLLEEYHKQIGELSETRYFDATQELLIWSNTRSLARLQLVITNREDIPWTTGPAIVNAFYSPNINRITFPAGILQSPFYTYGLPAALNLGAIGMVIGHEITHGFDDSGSQYDKFGNLFDWWDNNTKAEFNNKVQCFINQYTNYTDPLAQMPLNGSKTIGENIADNGGIRQAFTALQNYNGVQYSLPGSMKNFTSDQLFFLSFANVWCSNFRREAMISAIQNDVHSPGKYRVIGSVSNSEGFAKAFNCKVNDNMNPPVSQKCIIW